MKEVIWADVCLSSEMWLAKREIPFNPASTVVRKKIKVSSQPRIDGRSICEDVVDKLVQAIKIGDALPPLFTCYNGRSTEAVVQGAHRLAAIDRLRSEGFLPEEVGIRRYLLQTKDEYLLDLARTVFNSTNGRAPSLEQRKIAAVEMMRRYPQLTSKMVACDFFLESATLSSFKRGEDIRRTLIEQKAFGAAKLSNTTLKNLAPLEQDVLVLKKAAQVVIDNRLSSDQTVGLSKVVRRKKSESARMEAIQQFEVSLPKSTLGRMNGKRKSTTTWDRLYVVLRNVSSLIDKSPTIQGWGITSEKDRQACRDLISELSRKMKKAVR